MNKIKLNIQGNQIKLDFNHHFANLAKINENLNQGAAQNYQKQGLTYIDVPEIVGITGACENVDTLFKTQNRLDLPLFFTQTGQLSLEQALQSFPGVFTVIHSGRDEVKEDKRHLRQFRLTEEEFDCSLATPKMTRSTYNEGKMFDLLLAHVQSTIQSMIARILKDNKAILRKTYKRDTTELEHVSKANFLKISYEDAVIALQQNGYPQVTFGDDLKARHEAKIIDLLNAKNKFQLPVFITHYPQEIKFFNMKVFTKDPRVVLSADLILPLAGEAVGSAVREHNYKKLNHRLITSTMFKLHTQRGGKYQDFAWYLDIIKNKRTNPHAGYGVGNERVLQYIFGETDVRNVSLFSLLNKQTKDWDKTRYGQSAIVAKDKKYILLTIGKTKNKKILLPYIRKLTGSPKFVLHATRKTQKFLKGHGINTNLVHKISQIGQNPNIADLLHRRVFDIIINIPTSGKIRSGKEFTDGKLIRKAAIDMGIHLITSTEVAAMTINHLAKTEVTAQGNGRMTEDIKQYASPVLL